jgi:hypothetical protein
LIFVFAISNLQNVRPRYVYQSLQAHARRILTSIVVARLRPLLDKELDKDVIVNAEGFKDGKVSNMVRIPNPKNEAEEFSFAFNGVYDMDTTQEELFTNEGKTHTKHCFLGPY